MGSSEGIFTLYGIRCFLESLHTYMQNDNGILLDVGCGAGNTIRHVRKHFGDVKIIGLDISPSALRYASEKDEKSFFIRGDAEELPIRSDSIDYTVSLNLLEHLPNPGKAIREHHRVLKEGGIFHSLTPCEGEELTIHGRSKKFQALKTRHFGHIHHFRKRQIRNELEKIGFTIVNEKHSFFYFSQLLELFIHLFVHLLRLRMDKDATKFSSQINLVRALVRNCIVKIDLKFSNRFPNHSKGYHVTARE